MIDIDRPICTIVYSSKNHVKYIEYILYIIKECVGKEGYNPFLLREKIKSGEDCLETLLGLFKNYNLAIII